MTFEEARELLAACELHSLVGLDLLEFGRGRVLFSFRPPPAMQSGEGTPLHGGALATVLDTAATMAVAASVGRDATTVDIRIDYLRPAFNGEYRVEGRTVRAGRRAACAEATVSTLDGRAVAVLRGTFMRVEAS